MARITALLEVALVVALFAVLALWLKANELGDWQKALWGSSFLSNSLLLFILPLLTLLLTGRNAGCYGLAAKHLKYHARIGLRLAGILLPATLLFPAVTVLGTDPMEWFGASILGAGFAGAGLIALKAISRRASREPEPMSSSRVLLYAGLLLVGMAVGVIIHRGSEVLARVLFVLVFVGLLEEFFFRGYLQGRLNDVFDRPFSVLSFRFGPGLVVSALVFGLFHPIMSPSGTPWPWALWTTVIGLVFGLVREKTGAILATALAHGIFLLPMVFFGG